MDILLSGALREHPGAHRSYSAIRARRPRSRPFLYVTLRGSMANPPWSYDNGPPSRVLMMLSLRAEADRGDRVHDRCREMLVADDV